MSGDPFVADIYAVARMDYCRMSRMPGGGLPAQLVCNDLARQCGSFTNSTRDRAKIARTAPQLQELLRGPEFQRWEGKCPIVEAEGVCGLGGARHYSEELWNQIAEPREAAIYDAISGKPSSGPIEEAVILRTPLMPPTEAIALAASDLRRRPVQAINDTSLFGLPFL